MPGTRDQATDESWFEDLFGFRERDYKETRENLEFSGEVLTSKVNGRTFQVGSFDLPTLAALRYRSGKTTETGCLFGLGSLRFDNVLGSARALHVDPANAGAVFQVDSLFNCLETTQPGRGPEAGIRGYATRPAQGPAAAMACPAAAAYRNYFVNGGGQLNNEVDCLAALGRFVRNSEERYWTMVRGYCLPVIPGHLAELSQRILDDQEFERQVKGRVQVGIHWDTEVRGAHHQVCQVFCSAMPIPLMKQRAAADWIGIADAVLEAGFDATLTAATLLAAERTARVKVYLTALGAGELGNRRTWIIQALSRALNAHADEPLDVMLVHYAEVPPDYYLLEEGRHHITAPMAPSTSMDSQLAALKKTEEYRCAVQEHGDSEAAKLSAAFAHMDTNGDGVIDRRELMHALTSIDEGFFTANVVNLLFNEADCAGDGVIHYGELVDWLCSEDEDIKNSIYRLVH